MIQQNAAKVQYVLDFDSLDKLNAVASDMLVIGQGIAHYLYAIDRQDVETIALSLNGKLIKTFEILDILERLQPCATYRLRRKFVREMHSQTALQSIAPL
jgi:hypothetical protein